MKTIRAFLAVFLVCLLLLPGCAKNRPIPYTNIPSAPAPKNEPSWTAKADTATLLGRVLTYPLLADAFTSSTFGANPAEVLAEEFNGMKELLRRDDLGNVAKEFDIETLEFSKDYEIKLAERMLSVLQTYTR